MVDMIEDLALRDIPVFPDFHVAGVNCDRIVKGQSCIDYPDDPNYVTSFEDIKTRDFPRGSVVFLDELIKEFDNRLTIGTKAETKYRVELTQGFMQLRKKHVRTVHSSQIARTIEWRLLWLSEFFVIPEPTAYKEIDSEVFNVAFRAPVIRNHGMFGFEYVTTYLMDENRFWLYADEYDTDEPVLSSKERDEAKARRESTVEQKPKETNANGDDRPGKAPDGKINSGLSGILSHEPRAQYSKRDAPDGHKVSAREGEVYALKPTNETQFTNALLGYPLDARVI